jgi:hypothetical protein
MKVSIQNKEQAIKAGFSNESYLVIAYGENPGSGLFYLLINDKLHICRLDSTSIQIIDNDTSEFVQQNKLNFNRQFFMLKIFLEIFPNAENYFIINTEHIWNSSKLFPFFKLYNYKLTDRYIKTAVSEEYKFNLIEGYLLFANAYILKKFEGGHYFEEFEVEKAISFKELQEFNDKTNSNEYTDIKIKELDIKNYKAELIDFISAYLNENFEKEEKSKPYVYELFQLFDSIFIHKIGNIFLCVTHYNHSFIVYYSGHYYYLTKFWYG